MPASLLTTKLYIPPGRPELVPRPRLIEQLNAGFHRKLTLISAPAGFGKTTLVTEWLSDFKPSVCGRPEIRNRVAWLSLDEGDNDPARFLTYLIAALQRVDEGIGRSAQSLLGSPQVPSMDSLVTAVINDIVAMPAIAATRGVAGTPEPLALVLDDYHAIHAEQVHEAVGFLVTHQPPQMHLVLVTREDPPLPLPRLRVRGQVTEVRADDLRFTAEEATAFLNRALGLTLNAKVISALEARTEGWIAGLQLAALSMRGKAGDSVDDFVAAFSGSHRHVIDYLADEVLSQQPDEIRDFLRQTAILDRLTGPLCDAIIDAGRRTSDRSVRQAHYDVRRPAGEGVLSVVPSSSSQQILEYLERANLFLLPLDHEREWYRYHHLFADFLRTELDEGTQTTLHLKASRWFAGHNLLPEAVKHGLASGDMAEAAQVIVLAAEEAFRSASFMTLLGWLEALPDQLVRANGELATYKGLALLVIDQRAESARYAAAAERSLPSDASPASRGRLLCLQANVAMCNDDLDAVIQLSKEALDCLDEGDALLRDLTANALGQALEGRGDVTAAVDVYRDAVQAGRKAGGSLGVVVPINLALALNELGQRREAVASCRQILQESESQPGHENPLVDSIYLAWSLLSYEANELDLAREQVLPPLDLCKQMNLASGTLIGQNVLAQILLASGEVDAMLELSREARQQAARLDRDAIQGAWFAALEAEARLRQGDLAGAARWAEAAKLAPTDSPHYWNESVYFTYVRLLLAQGRLEDARTLLATIERSAQQGGRNRKLITVDLQQGLVEQAMGHRGQALARVEHALRLAAPEDYRRAFLNEGQAIAELLPQARHVAPAFVDGLLDAFSADRRRSADLRPSSLVEPLTDRELEILRLIAAGRSNPEIGELLYLSLNTVKWHVKNLYGKLDVSSRIEAVAHAQELGLL